MGSGSSAVVLEREGGREEVDFFFRGGGEGCKGEEGAYDLSNIPLPLLGGGEVTPLLAATVAERGLGRTSGC